MSTNNNVRGGGLLDEPTLEELKAVGTRQSALCEAWLEQFDLDMEAMTDFAAVRLDAWSRKNKLGQMDALSKLDRLVADSSQGGVGLSPEEQAKVDELRELIEQAWARAISELLTFAKDSRFWSMKTRGNAMVVNSKMDAITIALEILDKKGLEGLKEHPRGTHVGDILASWDEDVKMSKLGWSFQKGHEHLDLPRRAFHPDMVEEKYGVSE
ncbi:hypothetical protein PgNI_10765 [Pyricularia grisea]|uniref:Uncharacterized protein n=1 Tax=Pyricularia grisea TaxID=148305 RepID=A0A6P8AXL1_PYRGI|nr:hypothetical protein PgNI_10765 [Pyricularia grisea]TLD07021.1 hypothetical protein PgNI_10765 [Pyricularia grisea]